MNKKISVSVALAITLIAMTVTFAITVLVSMNTFNSAVYSVTRKQAMYEKVAEVDNYVRGNYFGEIDETQLNDRTARGYIDGLGDRFSSYYTAKEYTEQQQVDSGEITGAGVETVKEVDGYFRIVRVYADSPAAKAGVSEGGTIIAVDGVDTKAVTTPRALKSLMRGEPGTMSELTCLYGPTDQKTFSIQYAEGYRVPTVEWQMAGRYAYVRVSSFGVNTATDFDYAVQQAQSEGALGFVFDLRGTSGSSYDAVYPMIDLLCPRGTVARSENKSGVTRVLATSDESAVELPMVTLVNENTAGAAELFAVSVRDLSGGRVVGTKTMGRGTLQSTPYRLSDGSAVSITVAKLLTGTGESYDEVGVLPDIEIASTGDEESALLKPDPAMDNQILRALEVVYNMAKEWGLDDGSATPEDAGDNSLSAAQADTPGSGTGEEAAETTASEEALPASDADDGEESIPDADEDVSDAVSSSGEQDETSDGPASSSAASGAVSSSSGASGSSSAASASR